MEIRVTAPNRIDLAGGTTDLYPLFLLLDGGCTVNAAVTVTSKVTLRSYHGQGVRIVSEDLGEVLEVPHIDEAPLHGPLGLVCRAVQALAPAEPVEIVTRNQAPPGSGLGASSALLVALLVALLKARGEEIDPAPFIDLAANIETAQIGVPAGKQDYIAAYLGGISLLEFGCRGFR
jgi:D-glycero-alpha-D-manno-heptose-7-phosphate kinase